MNEYDVISLKRDIKEANLKQGAIGTIVMVYNDPNLPIGYEVEFINDKGETLALLTLYQKDIEVLKK